MTTQYLSGNNIRTYLASGITGADTSIVVADGSTAGIPEIAEGQHLVLTLTYGDAFEVVWATAISGTTLTVERGKEGTAAQYWPARTVVEHRVTKGQVDGTVQHELDGADYFVLNGRAGLATALQASLEAYDSTGQATRLAPGTALLKEQAILGAGGTAFLGVNDNTLGAGRHFVILGAEGGGRSILSAGVATNPSGQSFEQILRFVGDSADPIYVTTWNVGIAVGAMTTTRPQAIIREGVVNLRDLSIFGTPKTLAAGAGLTLIGNTLGLILRPVILNSAGIGINVGTGNNPGQFVLPGDRPTNLRFVQPQIFNFKSNALNIHGSFGCVVENTFIYHDLTYYPIFYQNSAHRCGNGGDGLRWQNCFGYGAFRWLQCNDQTNLQVSGLGYQIGGPGMVFGEKDYRAGGNLVNGVFLVNIARLRGWPQPGAAPDDPDAQLENSPYLYIQGGQGNIITASNGSWNDYRLIGTGNIVSSTSSTIVTIVDSSFVGDQYTAASKMMPGDLFYSGTGDEDTPALNGRITTIDQPGFGTGAGGLGPRVVYSGPNGSGTVVATIPWGTDPPAGSMVAGRSVVQQVVLDGNALLTQGDIATLGDPTQTTGVPYRQRWLREQYWPYYPNDAYRWIPTAEPLFFAPGGGGNVNARATFTAGSTAVTGTSANFDTWVKPFLDEGSAVTLYENVSGRAFLVGPIASVGSGSAMTLSATARRGDNTPKEFFIVIENKVRWPIIVGHRRVEERRARGTVIDWNILKNFRGFITSTAHCWPECMAESSIPKVQAVVPAQTVTTSTLALRTFPALSTPKTRQRVLKATLTFEALVAGDPVDYVSAQVERLRAGTARVIGSYSVTKRFQAANIYSDVVQVVGYESTRDLAIVRTGPTFTPTTTLTLQYAVAQPGEGTPTTWTDYATYTGIGTTVVNDGRDGQVVYWRIGIKSGEYTPGDDLTATLNYAGMVMKLTDRARAAGDSVIISGPEPLTDEMLGNTENDLIRPEQNDIVLLRLVPSGAGGAIPDLPTVFAELPF